jgi:hypothetical protein
MSSFARKLKRKKFVTARKQFMKDFRSKMQQFKKQVKCSKCDYRPSEGESIDDWHIDQESNTIDLICTKCYTQGDQEGEVQNEI